MFRPKEAAQMTTAIRFQAKTKTGKHNGVEVYDWTDLPNVSMCNFKTYGGTDKVVNDVLVIEETAVVTCWYRPDVNSGCRIVLLNDGSVYEILGDPENIEMRNMFLRIKVRRIKGGV